MKYFPLFIQATNKTIIIFGGGRDAAAKLRLVLKTEADVLVVTQQLDPSELQLGSATLIAENPLAYKLPNNVAFAYAATGDKSLDAAVAKRVRAAGILVCAADQPEVSDFSTPALVDRDPVVVAIGTEGTAPVLARNIKADVEALLPNKLGVTARLAAKLRPWVAEHVGDGLRRRSFWKAFFKAAPTDELKAKLKASDLARVDTQPQGLLSLVGAGPGDAGLLTLKARDALDRADTVVYDQSVSAEIRELARREALVVPFTGNVTHDQITKLVNAGEHVVWISANMPNSQNTRRLTLRPDHIDLIPGVSVPIVKNFIRKAA